MTIMQYWSHKQPHADKNNIKIETVETCPHRIQDISTSYSQKMKARKVD